MKKQMLMAVCALVLMASPLAAQSGSGSGSGSGNGASSAGAFQTKSTTKDGKTTTTTVRQDDFWAKWVKTLTNVQIELTLTDQLGTQTAEKKTVSMIASSGNFGKIRSGSTVFPPGEPPYSVVLNVDARPFVSIDGPIQLELTLVYEPVKVEGVTKSGRPSGINQSQTIILQSGKPLIVSQAADPVSDRKVVVEVKATVLK
jgi:hypothetical protein